MEDLVKSLEGAATTRTFSIRRELWSFHDELEDLDKFDRRDAKNVSRLLEISHLADSMAGMVDSLSSELAAIRAILEPHVKPVIRDPGHGLKLLPNETLMRIIELTVVTSTISNQPILLSHVSQRFRALCLAQKQLWTVLRFGSHIESVGARIERSKGADLHVEVHARNGELGPARELNRFLRTCCLVCDRWRSLSIIANFNDFTLFEAWPTNMLLPRLEHLHMINSLGSAVRERDYSHFYTSWESPNVQYLDCFEFVPQSTNISSNVKGAKISVKDDYVLYNGLDESGVIRYLQSARQLQRLDLSVDDLGLAGLVGEFLGPIVLPELTSLHFSVSMIDEPDVNCFYAFHLMHAMWMPKLSDFTLSISHHRGFNDAQANSHSVLYHLIPHTLNRPLLSHVAIVFKALEDDVKVRVPIAALRGVERLSLETNAHVSFSFDVPVTYVEDWSDITVSLQELAFSRCPKLDWQDLVEFMLELNEGEQSNIRKIIIDECPKLQRVQLLNFVEEEKLVYVK